jgi:eukaryotic-like serine/threonine-protein kinase
VPRGQGGAGARDCLDETTVALFLDRRLSHARAIEVEAHIDRCSACRRLVSALARGA